MDDALGDRMKMFEGVESDRIFLPQLPVCARIDGKCFSKFTKGMKRPYDIRMSNLMVSTTKKLVEETNARCGYTQSDEISLVWYEPNFKSQIYFNGRIQKMASTLAALATAIFNEDMYVYFDEDYINYKSKRPIFDCRVWQVPNLSEAANTFLWRELDATRNSIEMAARCYFSHNECMYKDCNKLQDMLMINAGINWNDYPRFFKRGAFIQKKTTQRKFTVDEIEKLPPMHEARKNPNLVIERSDIIELDIPPFSKVTNREDVIFFGKDPVTAV